MPFVKPKIRFKPVDITFEDDQQLYCNAEKLTTEHYDSPLHTMLTHYHNQDYKQVANRESVWLWHRGPRYRDAWEGFTVGGGTLLRFRFGTLSTNSTGYFTHEDDSIVSTENVQTSTGSTTAELIADAKRVQGGTKEQATSNGAYQRQHMSFRLPADNVQQEPQVGDLIIDGDDDAFIIQHVSAPVMDSVWHCFCAQLRLQDLGHTVSVYAPVDGTNGYTDPLTGTVAIYTNIPCALQNVGSEDVSYHGKRGLRETYVCWTFLQEDLPMGSLLVDENSVKYRVTGTKNRDRIDELMQITCVRDI